MYNKKLIRLLTLVIVLPVFGCFAFMPGSPIELRIMAGVNAIMILLVILATLQDMMDDAQAKKKEKNDG